ncbi:unnamed protein product [Rhizophagus irregularis]|nr:unnamed protein product [Rhizophagus irregularis]
MEKTPTIELRSLKNIEYYTDGSLANQIIDTNNHSHNMADNTMVNSAFYTNNEEGKYSVYSSLSFWPSSTRAEIVAIILALLTAPENSNVTIYTVLLIQLIQLLIQQLENG